MNRRDWLTKTSLALAGGLLMGDAVMEQYERLTHRKVFALGAMGDDTAYVDSFLLHGRTLPAGNYRMNRYVRIGSNATAVGSVFRFKEHADLPFLLYADGEKVVLNNCHFVTVSGHWSCRSMLPDVVRT